MVESDSELLSRIAFRDTRAFAAFFERHSGRVLSLLTRITGTLADAEDALQDTFWHVWSKAATFDSSRGTPNSWLALLARSRGRDLLRRRRGVAAAAGSVPEPPVAPPDAGARESLHMARSALDHLSEEQRSLIALSFFGGYTHEQIAEMQSMPLGTVKTRIRTGMQRLRSMLNAPGKVSAS